MGLKMNFLRTIESILSGRVTCWLIPESPGETNRLSGPWIVCGL
jgi:hypothetical protein